MRQDDVKKGQEVLVVRGKKTPLGTKGRVFWVGGPYFYSSWQSRHGGDGSYRVGIMTADGTTHFTDVKNVEPVNPTTSRTSPRQPGAWRADDDWAWTGASHENG